MSALNTATSCIDMLPYRYTGATLQVDTGATLQVDTGATLQVDTGATLQVDTGATLQVDPGATLWVDTGATLWVDTGATLWVDTWSTLGHAAALSCMKETDLVYDVTVTMVASVCGRVTLKSVVLQTPITCHTGGGRQNMAPLTPGQLCPGSPKTCPIKHFLSLLQ